VRISVKVDYAIRAAAELASLDTEAPINADRIAQAQGIPLKFLLNILSELQRAGIVQSFRGIHGGFRLARPARQVSLADVIRAVEGPLATVHERRPEDVEYHGASESLRDVWIALRASLREVLENVTVADLVANKLPRSVQRLARHPDAWTSR
jgi:Rrf2 family protein